MHTLELLKYPHLKEAQLPFLWKGQGKKAIKYWLGYPGRAGRSHPARRRWWSWWWWSDHWTCLPLPGSDRLQLRRTPSHMPLRWTGSGSPQTTDRRWEPRQSGRSWQKDADSKTTTHIQTIQDSQSVIVYKWLSWGILTVLPLFVGSTSKSHCGYCGLSLWLKVQTHT